MRCVALRSVAWRDATWRGVAFMYCKIRRVHGPRFARQPRDSPSDTRATLMHCNRADTPLVTREGHPVVLIESCALDVVGFLARHVPLRAAIPHHRKATKCFGLATRGRGYPTDRETSRPRVVSETNDSSTYHRRLEKQIRRGRSSLRLHSADARSIDASHPRSRRLPARFSTPARRKTVDLN